MGDGRNVVRYRAIVGIKKSSATQGLKKDEREAIEIELMHDLLKFWDSSATVLPYYDPTYDTDSHYVSILQGKPDSLPSEVNIDDPESVMNHFGKGCGRVFFTEIPKHDRKSRNKALKEYEAQVAEYKRKHKKIPEELKEKYKYELIEPVAGTRTKLYAYSINNPNGMYSRYEYPIQNSYIDGITDVSASKLLNRNYGTMHDILLMGDLDFDGTFFPNVVFRNDGKVLESYPDYDKDKEVDPGGDPDEIRDFLEETMDREDYIAIIECEI